MQVRPAVQPSMAVQAEQARLVAPVQAVLSKVPGPQVPVQAAQVSAAPLTRKVPPVQVVHC